MDPFTLFEPDFARRALLATVFVALAGGMLGATVVLRELPFFAHSVGAGAYPALVLGSIWGASAWMMGYAGAILFAALIWLATRGRGADPEVRDTRTGLLVAAALAAGTVIASTYGSAADVTINPEAMLFGSVLTVTPQSLWFAALIAAVAAVAVYWRGGHWLAAGFDRGAARGLNVARFDGAMLQIVAVTVAAALPLTGALMAGALLVAPAATARIFTRRATSMTLASTAIAVVAGVLGLYLALAFDLPAGAMIAAVAGGFFVITAAAASLPRGLLRRAGAGAPVATGLLVALALTGCGSGSGTTSGSNADDSATRVKIVATTTQVADLVRQIGDDHVEVTTLLEAGADPHEFEPAPSDVAALEQARVIFKNGGEIDSWLQPAIDAAGGGRAPIDLSNGAVLLPPGEPADVAEAGDKSSEESAGEGDQTSTSASESFNAHWSLDPENLKSVALLVRDELIKADPQRRETYRARTAEYRATVAEANRRMLSCTRSVKPASRAVVAGHDDFVYLTQRFGFTTTALLRTSGHSEPSAADVERATAAARDGEAQAMLVSRGEAGRLDKAVADELNVPLLELYGDSLAASGEASTALGAITHNLGRIVDAAGGDRTGCSEAG